MRNSIGGNAAAPSRLNEVQGEGVSRKRIACLGVLNRGVSDFNTRKIPGMLVEKVLSLDVLVCTCSLRLVIWTEVDT